MLNLQIWRVKNSQIWSQTYVIIAVNINFQVHTTPGKVHLKFELRILGLHLSVLGIGNQERKECFEQQSNQLYEK